MIKTENTTIKITKSFLSFHTWHFKLYDRAFKFCSRKFWEVCATFNNKQFRSNFKLGQNVSVSYALYHLWCYIKNSIRKTDDPPSACELFQSYLFNPKHNRSTAGFQTFDIAGPYILSYKGTTKWNEMRKALKIILLQFLTLSCRVVKRAYVLKQNCSWKLKVFLNVYDVLISPGVKIEVKYTMSKSLKYMIFWNWLFFLKHNCKHKRSFFDRYCMKSDVKDFFRKCEQIRWYLQVPLS